MNSIQASVKIPLVFEEHQFATDCPKSRFDKNLNFKYINDKTLFPRSIFEMSKKITPAKDDMKQENSEALFDP